MQRFAVGILVVIESWMIFLAYDCCFAQEPPGRRVPEMGPPGMGPGMNLAPPENSEPDTLFPPLDLRRMAVGSFGQLGRPRNKLKIAQVFEDEKRILVNYYRYKRVGDSGYEYKVMTFFVEGINTNGLVSDTDWIPSIEVAFEVTGTTTYETVAGGSNTVFVLALAKADRVKPYLDARAAREQQIRKVKEEQQAAEEAERERKAKAEKANWRTWSDKSGAFKIEAKILGLINDDVVLKKQDGKTVRVALEKLSLDDQAWVRQWKEQRNKSR